MTIAITENAAQPSDLLIRLRDARHHAHMTQKTAAERNGVSVKTLIAWECGYRSLSVARLLRLAIVYGVTPGSLLDGLPPQIVSRRGIRPAQRISDNDLDRRAISMRDNEGLAL